MRLSRAAVSIAALAIASFASADPGTSFTYQGRLLDNGLPANGTYDVCFRIYESPDDEIPFESNCQDPHPVVVVDGVVTASINFGSLFDGTPYWLEVVVNGTPLAPRQFISATPYAMSAARLHADEDNFIDLAPDGAKIFVGDTGPFNAKLHVDSNGGNALTAAGRIAMFGIADTSLQSSVGVIGSASDGSGGTGIMGLSSSPSGPAIIGIGSTSTSTAILGINQHGGNAGFFNGDVSVFGNFNVQLGSKNFMIDNPVDPENEYLYHAAVESDELMNIYHGSVVLDETGKAAVTLERWFEPLNTDIHYQLTCVGGHAPVYVDRELDEGTFTIAGGTPGLKVCWQLTGVRHDPTARRLEFEAVRPKPAIERGRYLDPVAYGQPASRRSTLVPKLED